MDMIFLNATKPRSGHQGGGAESPAVGGTTSFCLQAGESRLNNNG